MTEAILDKLATVVAETDDVESLVRPLLDLLEAVTGLESTYVTAIDLINSTQHIIFARNIKELTIPEGLSVPWDDTLCKRALEEGRAYTDDVAACWGDSDAARLLGITTYLSTPIRVGSNELYGTLCGASASRVPVSAEARRLLTMFATLIARQIERERLLAQLRQENKIYSEHALLDPLTGVANRRALTRELERALANARRSGTEIHVAFIDLDGFKAINDQRGHDAGDRFLMQIASALHSGMRDGDFVARHGGDEFVFFGMAGSDDHPQSRRVLQSRLENLTRGSFTLGEQRIDYAGASVGVVTSTAQREDCESLIARADAAMYAVKRQRRA